MPFDFAYAPTIENVNRLNTSKPIGNVRLGRSLSTINGQKSGFNFVTIPIGGGQHESNEAGIITAQWNGETLQFHYLYNPGTERESERTETWTLSSNGNKLIDQEWTKRPDGQELRNKVVFDKQP